MICAILPGPWHPAVVAKLGATADQLFDVNTNTFEACGFGSCFAPISDFHRATMSAVTVGGVSGPTDQSLLKDPSWQPT